jgi:AraC family transcriptional regulator, transcriptional activator of pobA
MPPASLPIRNIAFLRRKYGPELLVDVGWLDELPGVQKLVSISEPHRLDFHDILLVTEGTGVLWLDGEAIRVSPGSVIFTTPGQVRRWRARRVNGLCLFFKDEFLRVFFNDALFVHRLSYFHPRGGPRRLMLTRRDSDAFRIRFLGMRDEIRHLSGDSYHLLRALLYAELVRLNRVFVERFGGPVDTHSAALTVRFRHLVDAEFIRQRRVAWYAKQLGVTPGHLSVVVRRELGESAKSYVTSRLVTEAKRLLLGGETAQRTAYLIGFSDPAYFGRLFCRVTGTSPGNFRRRVMANQA